MTDIPSAETEQLRADILHAVSIVLGGSLEEVTEKAIKRGWLDAEGAPTESGAEMIRALHDQDGTRSVFRPF